MIKILIGLFVLVALGAFAGYFISKLGKKSQAQIKKQIDKYRK